MLVEAYDGKDILATLRRAVVSAAPETLYHLSAMAAQPKARNIIPLQG
jgi:hypothetical protein